MPDFLSPARQCSATGATLPSDELRQSASSCDGGEAFTCTDQVPRVAPAVDAADGQLAYAYAATPGTDPKATCGTCFELRFTGEGHFNAADVGSRQLAGKRLIVQATNIGYDVEQFQFDVMIPGGGVGAFDACTAQWRIEECNKTLGVRYGGFLAHCQQTEPSTNGDLGARKACVRRMCDDVFGGVANLTEALQGASHMHMRMALQGASHICACAWFCRVRRTCTCTCTRACVDVSQGATGSSIGMRRRTIRSMSGGQSAAPRPSLPSPVTDSLVTRRNTSRSTLPRPPPRRLLHRRRRRL